MKKIFEGAKGMLDAIASLEEFKGDEACFLHNFMMDLVHCLDVDCMGHKGLLSYREIGELFLYVADVFDDKAVVMNCEAFQRTKNIGGEKNADNNKPRRNDTEDSPLSF